MELGEKTRLNGLEEDFNNLREVWQELNKIWTTYIEPVNETPFTAYVSKKVQDLINGGLEYMKQVGRKIN